MFNERLIQAVDWFIPRRLHRSTATLWRARIFVISHLLGPFSAVGILGYLYRVQATLDFVLVILSLLCGSFWTLPFLLKFTSDLQKPTLLSFCTLTSISVFGSFFYGGVSSPFLPWFLTAQLLGFFYLSDRPLIVLGVIGTNLAGFSIAYHLTGSFPERVAVSTLSTAGMMSVCAATIYNSMMAIYYAYVMVAQSALRRESANHIETLLTAKREAEDANEAKAVFLAKMSHQLRTPLNAIIGYSEILLEDTEASGQTSEVAELKSIHKAGRHLLSLVSDVLHMPTIDAEDMTIERHLVDLDECLEEVVATCRNLVAQNGNAFTVEKKQSLGMVHTDERRLRQILINLLGNAGKFTKNGTVMLTARRMGEESGEQLLFGVKDTGIGIAPEALPKLFKNFNQVSSEEYGGSGLGLAVSQRLAQLLDGEISVTSQPQRGSHFTLRLPISVSSAVTAEVA